MSPSDYEMIEQGYDPPRMNQGELVYIDDPALYATVSHVLALQAENRALRGALRLARRFVKTETKYPAPGSRPETAAIVLATIDAAFKDKP